MSTETYTTGVPIPPGHKKRSSWWILVGAAVLFLSSIGLLAAVLKAGDGSDRQEVSDDSVTTTVKPLTSTPSTQVSSIPSTSAGKGVTPSTRVSLTPASTTAVPGGNGVPTPAGSAPSLSSQLRPLTATATAEREPISRLRCGGSASYVASNIIDGDWNTGWGASEGDGSGQSVEIDFGRQVNIQTIEITPGYLKVGPRQDQGCADVSAFRYNRRILAVTYTFDDGSTVSQQLADQATYQSVTVDKVSSRVAIRIDGTVQWGTDSDTIISDVRFSGLAG